MLYTLHDLGEVSRRVRSQVGRRRFEGVAWTGESLASADKAEGGNAFVARSGFPCGSARLVRRDLLDVHQLSKYTSVPQRDTR